MKEWAKFKTVNDVYPQYEPLDHIVVYIKEKGTATYKVYIKNSKKTGIAWKDIYISYIKQHIQIREELKKKATDEELSDYEHNFYSELYDYFDGYLKGDSWQQLEKARKKIASKWKVDVQNEMIKKFSLSSDYQKYIKKYIKEVLGCKQGIFEIWHPAKASTLDKKMARLADNIY